MLPPLLLSGLLALAAGPASAPSDPAVDREALELVEERTEAFANRLLDLSVATTRAEWDALPDFFAAQLHATPLPTQPESVTPRLKWIAAHGWTLSPEAAPMVRGEFLRHWRTFFEHFSEVEDARFKVKESSVEGTRIRGRVYMFVVGRDGDGRREWARGWITVTATLDDAEQWRIGEFVLESLESRVAQGDLFSEVGSPAHVAAVLPPYGSPQNALPYWQGAAAADVNLDGLVDVFVTGLTENYLYLNQGDGRFRNAAAESGTQVLPRVTAPLFVDVDNDGDPDLFLSSPDTSVLLENRLIPDGDLRFQDVSLRAGVGLQHAVGFSVVAGDVNRDGWPDVYVASYNHYGRVMPNAWHRATNGTPNLLFVNDGTGGFREAAADWGVADGRWSYAAQFVDVDEDGDQDLYVANDFGENGLFLNRGDRFEDAAERLGVLDPGNGMGVSFGDYDNDGDLDLHVTNMSSTAGNRILRRLFPAAPPRDHVLVKLASGNSLYENMGGGRFRNVTDATGGFSAGWAWGGGFFDFDNDGWEDLFTPNGFISGKSMKDT